MPAATPAARSLPRAPSAVAAGKPKAEPKILFQSYFKSRGPRTYAAQLKEAGNGNHFLVLTEGKRDAGSEDVRKTKLFVFSEDFVAFFKLMKETAEFIKANPVPERIRVKREKFWRKDGASESPAHPAQLSGRPPGDAAAVAADVDPGTSKIDRVAARPDRGAVRAGRAAGRAERRPSAPQGPAVRATLRITSPRN